MDAASGGDGGSASERAAVPAVGNETEAALPSKGIRSDASAAPDTVDEVGVRRRRRRRRCRRRLRRLPARRLATAVALAAAAVRRMHDQRTHAIGVDGGAVSLNAPRARGADRRRLSASYGEPVHCCARS